MKISTRATLMAFALGTCITAHAQNYTDGFVPGGVINSPFSPWFPYVGSSDDLSVIDNPEIGQTDVWNDLDLGPNAVYNWDVNTWWGGHDELILDNYDQLFVQQGFKFNIAPSDNYGMVGYWDGADDMGPLDHPLWPTSYEGPYSVLTTDQEFDDDTFNALFNGEGPIGLYIRAGVTEWSYVDTPYGPVELPFQGSLTGSPGVYDNSVLGNYFAELVPIDLNVGGDVTTATGVGLAIERDYENLPGLTPNERSLGWVMHYLTTDPDSIDPDTDFGDYMDRYGNIWPDQPTGDLADVLDDWFDIWDEDGWDEQAWDEFVADVEAEFGPDLVDDLEDYVDALKNEIQFNDLIAALDYSDLPTVQSVLAGLSPDSYFGLSTALINNNYRLHRMAQNHLAFVRTGGTKTVTQSVPSGDPKGGMTQTTTTTMTSQGNLWGAVSYDNQDYDGPGATGGDYDGDTAALTVGFDWRVAPDLVLGLMIDGSSSDYDGFAGAGADIDSIRIAAYGTWGEALGFYSDFLIGYGDHDLELTRSPFRRLNVLGANVGSTDATSWQAMATFGYNMGDDCLQHGPFAGLEYQNVDVDGFTESGWPFITMSDFDLDSLRGLLGYRVQANYKTFRPYGMVAYAHEFEDDPATATATLGGPGGFPFPVASAERSSAVLIGIGCGFAVSESVVIDLGYRGEIAVDGDGIDSHGASLGLNWAF